MKKIMFVAALLAATLSMTAAHADSEMVVVTVPASQPAVAITSAPASTGVRPDGPYLDDSTAFDAVARGMAASADQKAERALARPSGRTTVVYQMRSSGSAHRSHRATRPAQRPAKEKKMITQNFFSPVAPASTAVSVSAMPWWGWLMIVVLVGLAAWAIVHAVANRQCRQINPDDPNRQVTAALDPHRPTFSIIEETTESRHGDRTHRRLVPAQVAEAGYDAYARAQEARAEAAAIYMAVRERRREALTKALAERPTETPSVTQAAILAHLQASHAPVAVLSKEEVIASKEPKAGGGGKEKKN